MKIALLGGSFNPIHNGHLEIIKELLNKQLVERVWIIPCGNHAFNKKLADKEKRMKMINLAIGRNPLVKVNHVELNSRNKSYTSKTMKQLKKKFLDDFYFVIGADNLKDLNKWNDFKYLKENVEFILVKRAKFKILDNLKIKIKGILELNNEISSSLIRENIQEGNLIKGLVPEKVEQFIFQEGLYYE